MSESVNKTLTHAEQIFKDVVWDPLFATGQTYLLANVPILNLPVLHQMEVAAINEISSWAFGLVKEFIDVTYIRFKNPAAQSAFDKASVNLMLVAHRKGIDSDEFKKAREEAKAAMSAFTRISQ